MALSSDPVKVAAWQKRFSRFNASDMKTADFCTAENVSVASFYWWRCKLGLSKPRAKIRRGHRAFQEMVIGSSSSVTAHLRGGVRIEVPSDNHEALRTAVGEIVRAAAQCEAQAC